MRSVRSRPHQLGRPVGVQHGHVQEPLQAGARAGRLHLRPAFHAIRRVERRSPSGRKELEKVINSLVLFGTAGLPRGALLSHLAPRACLAVHLFFRMI
jgi:hypothetical protein